MTLINSRIEYGRIAKWLHWGVALLVLGSYVTMYSHQWFTHKHTFWHSETAQLHFSIGVSIGCLMLLRLIWRLTNPRPSLASLAPLQRRAARTSHALLYLLLFTMPVTGYLMVGGDIHWFNLFDITAFRHTGLFDALSLNKDSLEPLEDIHTIIGAWILWPLIAIHAAAGWHHHYRRRDDILRRMTSGT